MPLYEFACKDDSHPRQEHFLNLASRDEWHPKCGFCDGVMKRLPGGHGLLYFEEGRGRVISAFGDKPVTSLAEEKRLMRQHGVVEGGNTLPPNIAKRAPKAEAMKRFRSKDHKGRWV